MITWTWMSYILLQKKKKCHIMCESPRCVACPLIITNLESLFRSCFWEVTRIRSLETLEICKYVHKYILYDMS